MYQARSTWAFDTLQDSLEPDTPSLVAFGDDLGAVRVPLAQRRRRQYLRRAARRRTGPSWGPPTPGRTRAAGGPVSPAVIERPRRGPGSAGRPVVGVQKMLGLVHPTPSLR